jgi:hypothetical protein
VSECELLLELLELHTSPRNEEYDASSPNRTISISSSRSAFRISDTPTSSKENKAAYSDARDLNKARSEDDNSYSNSTEEYPAQLPE